MRPPWRPAAALAPKKASARVCVCVCVATGLAGRRAGPRPPATHRFQIPDKGPDLVVASRQRAQEAGLDAQANLIVPQLQ
jgi:hypothetical protein